MNGCQAKEQQFQKIESKNSENMNYVPDEKTAIKVAEAILYPIYGEKIYKQRPFTAILSNDVWIVKGSLPKGMLGGVAYIEIQKSDCRVLEVTHGK